MLEVFWETHNPSSGPYLRQYRNAIFYLNEQQRQIAEQSREQLKKRTGQPVATAIEAAGQFTAAEDYHQKHSLRRVDWLMQGLRQRYPDQKQLFESTAATRLNGYLGCFGEPGSIESEVGRLGLSPELQHKLLQYLATACREFKGVGCSLSAAQ